MDAEPETQLPLHRSLTLEDEFRLVILLPSRDFDSRIECRLEHAVIGSCKPYEALSYVWGKPEFDKCILLNDKEFFITQSLENALRHLRQPEVERTLWVDAICINQKDLAERREQVGYMRHIYSNCACDVLWMDLNDSAYSQEQLTRGFEIIRKLQGYKLDEIETLGWDSRPNVDPLLLYPADHHKSIKVGDMLRVLAYSNDRRQHWGGEEMGPCKVLEQTGPDTFRLELSDEMERYRLNPILSTAVSGLANQAEGEPPKRWLMKWSDQYAIQHVLQNDAVWKRVWIKQEIACAPKVVLTCSRGTLDWALVESLMDGRHYYTDAFHMSFSHTNPRSWTTMFGTAKSIKDQREKVAAMRNGEESTMMDVLSRFKDAQSTDPRDKIYGLLGLMSDTLGIEADYTLSVTETFTSVAVAVINSSANLDIICQSSWCRADTSRAEPPVENLPSWVPDFSNSERGEFLFAQRDIYTPARPTCTVPCAVDASGTLSLNGFRVGRLTSPNWLSYGTIPYTLYLFYDDYQAMYQALRIGINEHPLWHPSDGNKHPLYRTGEPLLQALWRTLVADTKGYPTVRLSADDVAHDHEIFQAHINGAEQPPRTSQMRSYDILVKLVQNGWQFHVAERDLFVLAQRGAREGDLVVVLDGGKTAMVVREGGLDERGEQAYRVVGGAYVHGLMDGEVLTEENGFKEETFRLV